jgi:uncharacterized protein (DUF302 family)
MHPERRDHNVTDYQLRVELNIPYEEALERVTAALKDEGFGVLTEIDVKSTLRAKLNADFRKYVILGACNPNLAHRALQEELDVGLLLPCNVIVYQEDGGSVVSFLNPTQMMSVADNPDLETIASEARERLERAARKLETELLPTGLRGDVPVRES